MKEKVNGKFLIVNEKMPQKREKSTKKRVYQIHGWLDYRATVFVL